MKYVHLLQKCKNEINFITLCKDDFDHVVFTGTHYELGKRIDEDQSLQHLIIGGEVDSFKIDGTCLIVVLIR